MIYQEDREMAAKIEDRVENVNNESVTYIEVATVARDADGKIEKGEDGKPVGKDDCYCGCGSEPQGNKARYMPGHDQRALGMLVRAQRAGRGVIFTPYSETEALDPKDVLPHMYGDKMVEKAQKRLDAIDAEEEEKERKAEEKAEAKRKADEEKAAAKQETEES